jgi:hypothetical protein
MVAIPRLGTSWDLANVFSRVPDSGNYLFFTFSSIFLLVWTNLVLSFLSVFLVLDIIFSVFLALPDVLLTLLDTSGCPWPKATLKPLCEIQVLKLRSHILKITS